MNRQQVGGSGRVSPFAPTRNVSKADLRNSSRSPKGSSSTARASAHHASYPRTVSGKRLSIVRSSGGGSRSRQKNLSTLHPPSQFDGRCLVTDLLRRARFMRGERHQPPVAPGLARRQPVGRQTPAAFGLDRIHHWPGPIRPPLRRSEDPFVGLLIALRIVPHA